IIVAAVSAPVPTLIVVGVLPLVAIPIAKLGRRVRKRSTKSLASLGASVEVLTQMFSGIRTVKAFRAEERELERYRGVNESYLSTAMRMVRAVATIEGATTFLSHFGFAVMLVAVGWGTLRFGLFSSPGDMTVFFGGIAMIYTHVKRMTTAINHVQEASGAADRLQAILDERPDITERPGAHPVTTLGSGIRFEDVHFTYAGQDKPAIDGLTLHIRPGETLALVGASGAGKTTTVDLIARFIDASTGRVTVDGRDLRELKLDQWTGMFAMVGQVPFLFHTSIRENILYGKPSATQAEVEAAARAAHIHDFIASLPQGYDTIVGDQGARLSGGQRQRITIARAILKDAPLLLLDEATSALDSESEAEVQRALEGLMKQRTVVVIAHRLSTIRNADRIAVLDQGRLVELGRHDELLTLGGAYARLHAMQFREPAGA
ncbi:MAG: ABC transporter ATP-binding protein, partial [Planctomycetota bacterium]|nr:ABC transporter ATP-binding protein [Planctomycetota bacterium]